MKPLIAVAQLSSCDDTLANYSAVSRLAHQARDRGASLVSFPENFANFAPTPADSATLAESLDGPLLSRYRLLAKTLKLEMSFGGFAELASNGKVFNTHVFVDVNGDIKAVYRKIHLFVVALADGTKADESTHVNAGSDLVCAQSSVGTLGLSICYDLRFAELYNSLSGKGAQVLLVPSAFTASTGKAHWEVLLRARAIENQCYVAAAAQIGSHPGGRSTHGHAMIVDPWGTIVAQCSDGEGLAFAEVDLEYLAQVRKQLPVSKHRRPELFS